MTLPELTLVPVKEEEQTTTSKQVVEEDQPSTMQFKSKFARKTSVTSLHEHKVRNPSALRLNLVPELKVLPARRTSVTYYPYARPHSAGMPIKQPDGQTRYFTPIPHPPPSPIYHQHPPPSPIYHQYTHHPHPPPSPIYHHHPTAAVTATAATTTNNINASPPSSTSPPPPHHPHHPHSPTHIHPHHQPPPQPTQLYVPYRPQFYYVQRCYPQRVYYSSPR